MILGPGWVTRDSGRAAMLHAGAMSIPPDDDLESIESRRLRRAIIGSILIMPAAAILCLFVPWSLSQIPGKQSEFLGWVTHFGQRLPASHSVAATVLALAGSSLTLFVANSLATPSELTVADRVRSSTVNSLTIIVAGVSALIAWLLAAGLLATGLATGQVTWLPDALIASASGVLCSVLWALPGLRRESLIQARSATLTRLNRIETVLTVTGARVTPRWDRLNDFTLTWNIALCIVVATAASVAVLPVALLAVGSRPLVPGAILFLVALGAVWETALTWLAGRWRILRIRGEAFTAAVSLAGAWLLAYLILAAAMTQRGEGWLGLWGPLAASLPGPLLTLALIRSGLGNAVKFRHLRSERRRLLQTLRDQDTLLLVYAGPEVESIA